MNRRATLTMKQALFIFLLTGSFDPLLYGQLQNDTVRAPALQGNLLNDSALRSVLVYLPPEYDVSAERSYPVVYLLHSYGATNRSWLGESGYEGMDITVVLDSLILHRLIEPLIVVMPDAKNSFGGSWYTDSPTTGHWETFVAVDLIGFIDGKYRTREGREARGITGQSMGGYGALRIAMNHPDLFGAVLGMSAPNLVNPDPLGPIAHEAALSIVAGRIAEISPPGRVLWSKAAAFSPNTNAPPLFADLPVRRTKTGIVRREHIWEQWLQHTLVPHVPMRAEALRSMRIRLEIGSRDPLLAETMTFANKPAEHRIPFSLKVFDGDHVTGVRKQFETSVFLFFDQFFRRHADTN